MDIQEIKDRVDLDMFISEDTVLLENDMIMRNCSPEEIRVAVVEYRIECFFNLPEHIRDMFPNYVEEQLSQIR